MNKKVRQKGVRILGSQLDRKISAKKRKVAGLSRSSRDQGAKDIEIGNWYDKYQPRCLDDVAIHRNKLEGVRKALEEMLSGTSQARILLLTGPAGCSKSTVVKLLSAKLVPQHRMATSEGVHLSGGADTYVEYSNDASAPPLEQFDEFLQQAKYRIGHNLAVALVEELPNVFHEETRNRFNMSLLQWLSMERTLPPLVICLTECEINDSARHFGLDTMFIAETLLTKEVLTHQLLLRIKFNPINATLLTKRLRYIAARETPALSHSKRVLVGSFIKELSGKSGDIRSAIAALQFWCQSTNSSGLALGRESSLNYFHAVGKVIYGSKDATDDETIAGLMSTGHSASETFRLGILENYAKFDKGNFPIDTAATIVDALSACDLLHYRGECLDGYSEFALRSVRHSLLKLKKDCGQHGAATFPKDWAVKGHQVRFKLEAEDFALVEYHKYGQLRKFRDIALYYGYYAPAIRSLRSFNSKSLNSYIKYLHDQKEIDKLLAMNKDSLGIDPSIDFLKRLGGDVGHVSMEASMPPIQSAYSSSNRLYTRAKLLLARRNESCPDILQMDSEEAPLEDQEFIRDPIEESGDEDFTLDDDSIYEIFSQKRPVPELTKGILHDESLSDSDLEDL
ncbi:AaceriAGR112Cp [[Ashbya] aceris (nom. inval.)]|nr:AaceriAGR112Cp [[Ashbya] aceris (nom. inval.)]